MKELPEVETAKALMTEAMSWSVMKWLREKKNVRKTADRANAALDQLSDAVKERWSKDLRAAYESLAPGRQNKTTASDPQLKLAHRIKEADDQAHRARMDAEKTFDDAERQLSTSMAREGCRKAIHGWELHEKAIRQAEGAIS
jgi:hypothetical protein